jgi:hypothetical protein
MTAVSLLFCFVFALFYFRFAADFYVSHRCETSEKITFFRIEAKNILLPFRFISLRSENDGAPYMEGFPKAAISHMNWFLQNVGNCTTK